MPIYEFLCQKCQKRFEELCSLTAAEAMLCPACGSPAKKQISGFAFKSGSSFKGSATGGGCSSCGGGSCSSCGH